MKQAVKRKTAYGLRKSQPEPDGRPAEGEHALFFVNVTFMRDPLS
jgi:hypothetical protein